MQNTLTYSFGGAFSMGSSKRQDINYPSSTPGPGTYNPDLVKVNSPRLPQYGIPQSPRKPFVEEKGVPPPGAYEMKQTIGLGHKVTISKMRYKEFGDKFETGPGSYEVTKAFANNQSSPQFTFTSRFEELKPSLITPGPGAYDIPDIIKQKSNANRSSLSFNQSQIIMKLKSEEGYTPSTKPGPGEYYQDSQFKNTQGTTFAKSGRMMLRPSDSPGPGHFSIPEVQKDTRKNFTLGQKIEMKDNYKSIVPGPGTYDLNYKDKKPKILMGNSQRTGLVKSDTPGPGSYAIPIYSKDDVFNGNQPENRGLGYSKRPDIINNKQSPGPGNYNLPEYIGKSTHVKISTNNNKGKWKVQSEIPGPGSYDINTSAIDQGDQFIVLKDLSKGTQIRGKRHLTDQSLSIPGPGQYHVSNSSISPKYSFTQQKRSKFDIRKLFEPSPGQYDIAGTISNIPSYLFQRKH